MGIFDNFGWDDLLSIPTGGAYSAVKQGYNLASGGGNLLDDVGGAVKDFSKVGTNNFQASPYQPGAVNWGGYEGGADAWTEIGRQGMLDAQGASGYAQGQMMGERGPQANENATLANREAEARGSDQAGAIQLAREAAMGMAPSEAAYLQQEGLNQAMANQTSTAGSARGAGAMAVAQGRAAGNTAGLMNQAYTQGSALRAQEMANARGQYGGLAGQQREQDIQRLGMGNQMSQFNANANDQYRLGMGQLGVQYGNQGLGWYQGAQNPYNNQANIDLQREKMAQDSYDNSQMVNAGVSQANADLRRKSRDEFIGMGTSLANTGGQMAFGSGGK